MLEERWLGWPYLSGLEEILRLNTIQASLLDLCERGRTEGKDKWMDDYQRVRQMRIVIRDQESEWVEITSEKPQGQ